MSTMNSPLVYVALMLLVCHYKTAAEVRLVGGSNSNEGRVEVSRGWGWFTSWGTVCDDSWGTNDAKVVCRQLGLPFSNAEAIGSAAFGEGSGDIFLDDVGCSGSESRLEDCSHPGWEEHNCGHSEDAGVRCSGSPSSSSSSSSSSRSDSRSIQVRLVSGSSSSEGRVEVSRNNGWGTVCDDAWSTNDAKVVCRQLGLPYSNAEALGNAAFGEGSGEIYLDDVGCSGSENRLEDCSHSGWGEDNCGHGEDAGVRCFGEDCYPNVGCFPRRSYCGDGVLGLYNTPRSPDAINTRFMLYTSSPNSHQVITNQMTGAQFRASGFDPSRQTKIVIHGFSHSAYGDGIVDIRNAFIDQATRFNIIMVNWNAGDILHGLGTLAGSDYLQATQDVRVVAKELQLLLQRLNGEVWLQYDDVHIIGASLGAHIAGLAGALVNGQLGRISGLDPAKPAFEGKDLRCRLDATDARFVDIIHTDYVVFGTNDQSGHVDFWPNFGHGQPGCFPAVPGCSHIRVLYYYAHSIRENCEYQSFPCQDLITPIGEIVRFMPDTSSSCSNCPPMGYNAIGSNEGEFCLTTTGASPFC